MASGGEVGDPDDKFAKAVNTKLGRTPDSRPLQQGLKPVFDLEDAANLTPVGDVITTKDIYNSVFTQEESQFIIKYLMNCLVYNEPFDCSSLGPNKYLNE